MPSFDVVSEINMQEIDNAVNQTSKEISTRYDFKNSKSEIKLDKDKIVLIADDEYKRKALIDVMQTKMVKRGIALNALDIGKSEQATGNTLRIEVKLVQGIEKEKAKEIVRFIKDGKFKVNTQIMDDQLRVSSKSRDELQAVITALGAKDFGLPLQYNNFRD